jgi:hypothetical protein
VSLETWKAAAPSRPRLDAEGAKRMDAASVVDNVVDFPLRSQPVLELSTGCNSRVSARR